MIHTGKIIGCAVSKNQAQPDWLVCSLLWSIMSWLGSWSLCGPGECHQYDWLLPPSLYSCWDHIVFALFLWSS